jgi:raffinose/stachyose/melibiose transport system substrate-binding protein
MKKTMVFGIALTLLLLAAGQLPAQAKIKIAFWGLSDQKSFLDPVLTDFQKANPNIVTEFTPYAVDALKESLKVAAASKTLPDLWFTWGGSLGSFYVENGMTADLTPIAKDHGWAARYNKAALDLSTYGGKLSGVPFHLNEMAVFYPKDLFAKLKLRPPKTFSEFEANLKALKTAKVVPLAFAGKNGWHLMRLTEAVLEHFAGPKLHDDLNSLEVSWKNEAVIKTFAKLKEWADDGYFPKGFVSLDPQEIETGFYQGTNMGYIIEGPWWDGNLISNGFDPQSEDFFPFPTDQTPVRMSSFAEMFQISAQASPTQRDAAIKLAEYLTGVEAVSKYVETYGSSGLLGAPTSAKTPHVKPMSDAVSQGNFLIGDQALPQEVVQKLFEATDKVLLKLWTPEQGAASIQAGIDAYKKK